MSKYLGHHVTSGYCWLLEQLLHVYVTELRQAARKSLPKYRYWAWQPRKHQLQQLWKRAHRYLSRAKHSPLNVPPLKSLTVALSVSVRIVQLALTQTKLYVSVHTSVEITVRVMPIASSSANSLDTVCMTMRPTIVAAGAVAVFAHQIMAYVLKPSLSSV